VKLAGLDDLCIHDMRRTFGSNCVMDGVSLPTVQAWMGHRDISTTIKHYGHLVTAFKKEEIKKIEGRMDTCMDTASFFKPRQVDKSLKINGAPGVTRTPGTRCRKPIYIRQIIDFSRLNVSGTYGICRYFPATMAEKWQKFIRKILYDLSKGMQT